MYFKLDLVLELIFLAPCYLLAGIIVKKMRISGQYYSLGMGFFFLIGSVVFVCNAIGFVYIGHVNVGRESVCICFWR